MLIYLHGLHSPAHKVGCLEHSSFITNLSMEGLRLSLERNWCFLQILAMRPCAPSRGQNNLVTIEPGWFCRFRSCKKKLVVFLQDVEPSQTPKGISQGSKAKLSWMLQMPNFEGPDIATNIAEGQCSQASIETWGQVNGMRLINVDIRYLFHNNGVDNVETLDKLSFASCHYLSFAFYILHLVSKSFSVNYIINMRFIHQFWSKLPSFAVHLPLKPASYPSAQFLHGDHLEWADMEFAPRDLPRKELRIRGTRVILDWKNMENPSKKNSGSIGEYDWIKGKGGKHVIYRYQGIGQVFCKTSATKSEDQPRKRKTVHQLVAV